MSIQKLALRTLPSSQSVGKDVVDISYSLLTVIAIITNNRNASIFKIDQLVTIEIKDNKIKWF